MTGTASDPTLELYEELNSLKLTQLKHSAVSASVRNTV